MTLQEALEYLNLTANSSRQLVRKRYLELKEDYLKAIYNAPSDHFSALYRENLDKIEEAYNLLIEDSDTFEDPDEMIQNSIVQMGQMVDTFLAKEAQLTTEDREKLQQYINQINKLQNQLLTEVPRQESVESGSASPRWDLKQEPSLENIVSSLQSMESAPEEMQTDSETSSKAIVGPISETEKEKKEGGTKGWRWEAKALRKKLETQKDPEPEEARSDLGQNVITKSAFIERWMIEFILRTSFATTSSSRRYFYNQLVLMTILLVLILAVTGVIYLLFPLFFPAN